MGGWGREKGREGKGREGSQEGEMRRKPQFKIKKERIKKRVGVLAALKKGG